MKNRQKGEDPLPGEKDAAADVFVMQRRSVFQTVFDKVCQRGGRKAKTPKNLGFSVFLEVMGRFELPNDGFAVRPV